MNSIAIVTDSAASLPLEVVERLGIHVVAMSVILGEQNFREGLDMNSEQLYDLLRRGEMPTTSQPAPGEFLEVFQPLVQAGQQVLAVFVTGKASGTVQSARIAAEMLPEGAVQIFDSESFGMGTGLLTMAAAEAALAGHSISEIGQLLERLRPVTQVFVAVPTLKYLQKSGRVNMAQALVGKVLNIKPILGTEQGLISVVAKARSWQAAVTKLVELAKQSVGERAVVVAVQHGADPSGGEQLLAKVRAELNVRQAYLTEVSASLSMHGGPGMLALALHPAE